MAYRLNPRVSRLLQATRVEPDPERLHDSGCFRLPIERDRVTPIRIERRPALEMKTGEALDALREPIEQELIPVPQERAAVDERVLQLERIGHAAQFGSRVRDLQTPRPDPTPFLPPLVQAIGQAMRIGDADRDHASRPHDIRVRPAGQIPVVSREVLNRAVRHGRVEAAEQSGVKVQEVARAQIRFQSGHGKLEAGELQRLLVRIEQRGVRAFEREQQRDVAGAGAQFDGAHVAETAEVFGERPPDGMPAQRSLLAADRLANAFIGQSRGAPDGAPDFRLRSREARAGHATPNGA